MSPPNRQTARPPNRQTARPPNHQTAKMYRGRIVNRSSLSRQVVSTGNLCSQLILYAILCLFGLALALVIYSKLTVAWRCSRPGTLFDRAFLFLCRSRYDNLSFLKRSTPQSNLSMQIRANPRFARCSTVSHPGRNNLADSFKKLLQNTDQ